MVVNSEDVRPSSLLPDTIEPREFLRAAVSPPGGEVLTDQAVLEALLAVDVPSAVASLIQEALSE